MRLSGARAMLRSMVDASTILRLHWRDGLTRGFQDAPLIAPLLVAARGPAVQIADVRPREEFDGVLGYIPGSAFVPVDSLDQLAEDAAGTPLVLVCADGEASARVGSPTVPSGAASRRRG